MVRETEDGLMVTDGPFSESKEHIGGFWIIEVDDLDAALAWAALATKACGEAVEVQPDACIDDHRDLGSELRRQRGKSRPQ